MNAVHVWSRLPRLAPLLLVAPLALLVLTACGEKPSAEAVSEQAPATAHVSETVTTTDPETAHRLQTVRRALEEGVEVDRTDENGRTAMMMAAFEGYTEVVRLLLDHGAAPDRRDTAGRTALMYASTGPFTETVELLLDRGAAVDLVDHEESWSALMFAAGEGVTPVAEVLLRHGANPSLADGDGDTAADHARRRGHEELAVSLEAAAADAD